MNEIGQSMLLAAVAAFFCTHVAAQDVTTIAPGESETINAFGVCRVVQNDNQDGIMVPHKSAPEWSVGANSFLAENRKGLTVSGCQKCFLESCGISPRIVKDSSTLASGFFTSVSKAFDHGDQIVALDSMVSSKASRLEFYRWNGSDYTLSQSVTLPVNFRSVSDIDISEDESMIAATNGHNTFVLTNSGSGWAITATLPLSTVTQNAPTKSVYTAAGMSTDKSRIVVMSNTLVGYDNCPVGAIFTKTAGSWARSDINLGCTSGYSSRDNAFTLSADGSKFSFTLSDAFKAWIRVFAIDAGGGWSPSWSRSYDLPVDANGIDPQPWYTPAWNEDMTIMSMAYRLDDGRTTYTENLDKSKEVPHGLPRNHMDVYEWSGSDFVLADHLVTSEAPTYFKDGREYNYAFATPYRTVMSKDGGYMVAHAFTPSGGWTPPTFDAIAQNIAVQRNGAGKYEVVGQIKTEPQSATDIPPSIYEMNVGNEHGAISQIGATGDFVYATNPYQRWNGKSSAGIGYVIIGQ